MKNPSEDEIQKALSPYHKSLYEDDQVVIPIAKAWVVLDLVLLEWQRSRVSQSNLETVAPVLLALNGDYKLLKLFADKGHARIKEIANQKSTHAEQ